MAVSHAHPLPQSQTGAKQGHSIVLYFKIGDRDKAGPIGLKD